MANDSECPYKDINHFSYPVLKTNANIEGISLRDKKISLGNFDDHVSIETIEDSIAFGVLTSQNVGEKLFWESICVVLKFEKENCSVEEDAVFPLPFGKFK